MRLPVDNAIITSHYGDRTLNGKKEFHDGIDFISRENNKVYSPFTGKVIYDQDDYEEAKRWIDKHHSAGNMVILKYKIREQEYFMRFVHIIENFVYKNQSILEGDVLGHYADVGKSYGAHLHNDLWDKNWNKLNIEEFYKNLGLL